jgi:hypothetical protein
VRQAATGLFTLALFAAATSASFANQTVTLTVPLNLTNLPPQITQASAFCYPYPPSVNNAALLAMANNISPNPVNPLAIGHSQSVTFAGPAYQGNLIVPVSLTDASLAGITQALPYFCWVNFYSSSGGNPVDPTKFFVLPPNTYMVFVTGSIPLQTQRYKP